MTNSIDAFLSQLEIAGELDIDQSKLDALDHVPPLTARVLSVGLGVPWTEVGVNRLSISIERRDLAKLGTMLLLASLVATDKQIWIPISRTNDDINGLMIPTGGRALVIEDVEVAALRYKMPQPDWDGVRSRSASDRWDLASAGLVLQSSLQLHSLGAPSWLQGAVVLGGTGSMSRLVMGKRLLDFFLSAGECTELLFDVHYGLAPGSLEACFWLPGSPGWHDPRSA